MCDGSQPVDIGESLFFFSFPTREMEIEKEMLIDTGKNRQHPPLESLVGQRQFDLDDT